MEDSSGFSMQHDPHPAPEEHRSCNTHLGTIQALNRFKAVNAVITKYSSDLYSCTMLAYVLLILSYVLCSGPCVGPTVPNPQDRDKAAPPTVKTGHQQNGHSLPTKIASNEGLPCLG